MFSVIAKLVLIQSHFGNAGRSHPKAATDTHFLYLRREGRVFLSRRNTPASRLRGGRTAVKILCLLGRNRLRRKRGRLFLRLEWRS
jgi:hypothetical protein